VTKTVAINLNSEGALDMKITKALFGLTLLATASSPAYAVGPFQVTAFFAPDSRPCAFFQVNNATPWYAIPMSDKGFVQEYELVLSAYMSGFAIQFGTTTPQTSCSSFYGTTSISMGTGY
jgi:hypothetical protein